MSETITRRLAKTNPTAIQDCPRVLVRSAFDDLSVLRVVDSNAEKVVVASEDGAHRTGVPRTHVFGYSDEARTIVEIALAGGNAKDVASAWARLEPYKD